MLFEDLSFYGPDKLNSRRSMTVWELEARRDRKYFKNVLEREGGDGLKREMVASLDRQSQRSQTEARVHAGKTAFTTAGRQVELAFVDSPNAPVGANNGHARVINDEARTPTFFVQNRSGQSVRGIEMGWLIKDGEGREYVSGPIPFNLDLGPRQKTRLVQDTALRFSQAGGQGISIDGISAFLTSIEFEDGSMWVPERSARFLTPSPEEQRLSEMYRKRGLPALTEELKKF